MALSFEIEPFEKLHSRVPAAMARVWDINVIAAGNKDFNDRPGLHRENVFDGRDDDSRGGAVAHGTYRVILSRERMDSGEIVLHASVSFTARRRGFGARAFAAGLVESLLRLNADAEPLRDFTTVGGVFHWVYPGSLYQEQL